MDVTAKEAFRLGFLTRCAEEGLSGEALSRRIESAANEKQAWFWPALAAGAGAWGLSRLLESGSNAANAARAALQVPEYAGRAALTLGGTAGAAGLLGGGALGYGAAKMTEPEVSSDDIKQQELAETYRIYANRARAKRKARKYRPHAV